MHGEQTRLHAEADEEDNEEWQRRSNMEVVDDIGEVCRTCDVEQHHKASNQEQEADMHHNQVVKRSTTHILTLRLKQYEYERCDGHKLPREEERETTARNHHKHHRHHQTYKGGVVHRDVSVGVALEVALDIATRVEHRSYRSHRNDDKHECREFVDGERLRAKEHCLELRNFHDLATKCHDSGSYGSKRGERYDASCHPHFSPLGDKEDDQNSKYRHKK